MSNDQEARWQDVADAVLRRLEDKNLQQNELAEMSGVGEDTISKIVNVRATSYRRSTLKKLAKALGWPDDAFNRILAGEDAATLPDLTPSGPGIPEDNVTRWPAGKAPVDQDEIIAMRNRLNEIIRKAGWE